MDPHESNKGKWRWVEYWQGQCDPLTRAADSLAQLTRVPESTNDDAMGDVTPLREPCAFSLEVVGSFYPKRDGHL